MMLTCKTSRQPAQTANAQYAIRVSVCLLLAILALIESGTAFAQSSQCSAENAVGRIVSVENSVRVLGKDDTSTDSAGRDFGSLGDAERLICPGDQISVGRNSRAGVVLFEMNSVLRLDEYSFFIVNAVPPRQPASNKLLSAMAQDGPDVIDSVVEFCRRNLERSWLELKKGSLRLFTTQPQRLNIRTPHLNASVEGTEFLITTSVEEDRVSVVDGKVGVCNKHGSELANSGEEVVAVAGKSPQKVVEPLNASQWTLYYPPLLSQEIQTDAIKHAYELIISGQAQQAMELLGDDTNAVDLALRSVVKVSQNAQDEAARLADLAIRTNSESGTAWIAKSYVSQSRFKLKTALEDVENARKNSPDNVFIEARYAELLLSTGNPHKAYDVARVAASLDPEESRVHTVLGFVQANRGSLDAAKKSFLDAISNDESDPLPRLGLGLINIRQNDLVEGRRIIETAVGLYPENSLLRSYLGKVYALLGRTSQAREQYDIAIRYDKLDPTPHLYYAFLEQSVGLPLAALTSLQNAISNNDNRAVYRSRLDLDEDLATSTASSARIYQELGFDHLALLEGAKSLAIDPTSYSAHRFMADAYLTRPRHEVARVSELLQSQLRQPLNNNPAQVNLSDSELGAYSDSGPYSISVNEYSRLFSRDGLSGNAALEFGSDNSLAQELQLSALHGNTSATFTAFDYTTDGDRQNSDFAATLYGFMAQQRLGTRGNFQFEFKNIDSEFGDRFYGFDSSESDNLIHSEVSSDIARLGLHYRISPSQNILINVGGASRKELDVLVEDGQIFFTEADGKFDGLLFEAQYDRTTENATLIAGVGQARQDRNAILFPGTDFEFIDNDDVIHNNGYVYVFNSIGIDNGNEIDLVAGASYDNFSSEEKTAFDTEKLNPKFGLSYQTGPTTFRLAAFRVLQRTLTSNQTLEPTNIVGFNQFYDNQDSTVIRTYAAGVDSSFSFGLAGQSIEPSLGIAYASQRLSIVEGSADLRGEWHDDLLTSYVYLPMNSWSIGFELEHQHLEREPGYETLDFIRTADSTRARISVDHFTAQGVRLGVSSDILYQSGDFVDRIAYLVNGSDAPLEIVSSTQRDVTISTHLVVPMNNFTRFDGSVALSIDNLLDEKVNHQDIDPLNSRYSNGREVSIQVGVRFM